MEKLTFNDLPDAFAQFYHKLENIERLLNQKNTSTRPETEQLLTVQQAAAFLTLSVPTVYGLISKGSIPYMKRSKRVYFSQQELISYLKEGKKKTTSEIEAEADAFLSSQKRKGGMYAQR